MRWQGLAIVIYGGLCAVAVDVATVAVGDGAQAQSAVPAPRPAAPAPATAVDEIKPAPSQPAAQTGPALQRRDEATFKAATDAAARSLGMAFDAAGSSRAHPLAASYPDHNVVVCEAGCPKGRNSIVYMAPRRPSGIVQVSNVITSSNVTRVSTSAGAPAEPPPASSAIECVAGCYGSRSSTGSRRSDQAASGRYPGTWLTATEPPQTAAGDTQRPRVNKYGRTRR